MNKKDILVIGHGFLGQAFHRAEYPVLTKTSCNITTKTSINSLRGIIQAYKARAVVNCIGKSNTRWCEDPKNFSEMMLSNAKAPELLSKACALENVKFVHISTGCLYDNPSAPATEETPTAAHCNYVVSKWVGEKGCDPSRDLILRPRLYFGDFNHDNNLLCKMRAFTKFGNTLDSFTSVHTIVSVVQQLLDKDASGIFNVTNGQVLSVSQIENMRRLILGKKDPWSIPTITPEELRKSQNLHLVNAVLSIHKLRRYSITTTTARDELDRCIKSLGG